MFTLFKKELNYYLNNPIGYIIAGLFSIFANFLFVKDIFVVGSASLRPFFAVLPWLFLIFVPALAMRLLAEEKRQNTLELLLTLPVSEIKIVLAKFLTLLSLISIGLFLTFSLPISLSFLTKIYYPEILIGYMGQLLLAAFFASLSLFFSNQTKNQIVAFLSAVLVSFILMSFSSDFLAGVLPKTAQDFLSYLSPLYHLQNFTKGVIDLRSFFYFFSLTFLFLFLTVIDLKKRQ